MMQRQFVKAILPGRSARMSVIPKRTFGSGTAFEKFDHTDPFKLNELLTEEEKMVMEESRKFCQNNLMPRVKDAYNNETFDVEIMREMGQQGLLGCTISDYDLPGVSSTAYGKYSHFAKKS